jgi:hypothetical protein
MESVHQTAAVDSGKNVRVKVCDRENVIAEKERYADVQMPNENAGYLEEVIPVMRHFETSGSFSLDTRELWAP